MIDKIDHEFKNIIYCEECGEKLIKIKEHYEIWGKIEIHEYYECPNGC